MQAQIDLLYKMMKDKTDSIEKKIDGIDTKVNELSNFKWKVVGFASCATLLGSIAAWSVSILIR